MSKRAILRFSGQLCSGYEVLLEIKSDSGRTLTEMRGELPALPQAQSKLKNWRSDYRQCLYQGRISGLQVKVQRSLSELQKSCKSLGNQLESHLNQWLQSPEFQAVNLHLQRSLSPEEDIQLLIRSDDRQIHQLPWHSWDILDHYPGAEIVLGGPSEAIAPPVSQSRSVRILAILGDSTGIDTEVDRKLLEALPRAWVKFLVEPSRAEISDRLWDQPWDILFFAGHSRSEGQRGQLGINAQEMLSIEELKFGLRKAIVRGLQLAIFNSCDGLGIAYDLEQLHIPQVIVMREPVPDPIAQAFLKQFLTEFSQGTSLHLALRHARERLQPSEDLFPNATWLPVLFQNPALPTPNWENLRRPVSWREQLMVALVTGLGTTIVMMVLRSLGLLYQPEVAWFDHLIRMTPTEPQDPEIVVVEIDRNDLTAERDRRTAAERDGRSLSDETVEEVLGNLAAMEPKLIGFDLYRDIPARLPALKRRLAEMDNLYTICKHEDPQDPTAESFVQPPEVPNERVGFSDIRTDSDDIVRAQLLYADVRPGFPCSAQYSFSALLAFTALETTEHALKPGLEHSRIWQWGNTAIYPMGAPRLIKRGQFAPYGPYFKKRGQGGDEIWLRYRASSPDGGLKTPRSAFFSVSLEEILSKDINPASFKDKIVLIGNTAPEKGDLWLTPYRDASGQPLQIPGVHLHAQMISQILHAERRPLLHAWPWFLDTVGVGGVVVVLLIGVQTLPQRWWIAALGLGIVVTYGMSRGAFIILGLYLPFVPLTLALSLGGVILIGWRRSQPDDSQLAWKAWGNSRFFPKTLPSE